MKKSLENKTLKTSSKNGKSLKEKMRRHLTDKNDVITEQDMKEVIVGVDAVDLENPDEPSVMSEDISRKKVITSWDIVDDQD